jgi:long-chain acyl-CoA synthetase
VSADGVGDRDVEGSPWVRLYGDLPASIVPAHATALDLARAACRRRLEEPLLHYFGTSLTGRRIAADSDALASALAARGVNRGDRVALYMQNVPQFPIAMIAAWKLGATPVTVNPMLRERELAGILSDSGASVLISLEDLHESVARSVLAELPVPLAITTSPLDYLDEIPSLLAGTSRRATPDAESLSSLITGHAGETPPQVQVDPDDPASIVYTSGTTGPAKGAVNLHRNFVFASSAWAQWVRLAERDINLALAPLFHVTGLIAGLGATLTASAPLVLGYRFDADTTLSLIERYRPTFTVAAITAYAALMQSPRFAETDLSCLRAAYSGGAPVAPATAESWRAATGVRVHNAYGLTETTSPLTLTPLGIDGPVDPASGSLSVGIPVFDSTVEIVSDDGAPVPPGTPGELVASGPQVIAGYWEKPEESAHALPDGRLRTGDVGVMDANGWVFLIDRRKDLIIASGYKVWPREVEEVLYTHPAVREAAVVGVPDEYRGETVKAVVSLKAGMATTPQELTAYCRERMAAYKYPRLVEIVDELPKTASGKILRRELRASPAAGG